MKTAQLFPMAILLCMMACTEIPELENIDLQKWGNDKNGCEGNRIEAIDDLLAQKTKLKGLSQNEVIQLLGTADKHQLYERSQKFFIYYIEANENCEKYTGGYVKALYIRFNSLDQAVAFNIQKVK